MINPDRGVHFSQMFGERFTAYLLTENSELSLRNTAWYMERLCERVPFHGDVLDLGCGFGVNALIVRECAGKVLSVCGLDPDEEKIGVFRKLVSWVGVDKAQPDVGRGEALPYTSASFDWVVTNECISHVQSIAGVLKEIRRVLRPGGKIVVSDTARWNPYALWFKYGRGHLDENYQSKQRMRRYLAAAGFSFVERVPGMVAPRNPWREHADRLWWLNRWIDPKYVLEASA